MFQIRSQNSLWTLKKWSLMLFVTLDDTRKNGLLSSWKQLIFKMFVSIDLLGPKEFFYHLHNTCRNTLWTLISCCVTYVMWDNTRKSGPNFFITGKNAFFFKTFYFQQPIRSWKTSYKFQSNCQNSLWTLIICSLMFVTSDGTRKNGPKNLSTWKPLFLKCLFLLTS